MTATEGGLSSLIATSEQREGVGSVEVLRRCFRSTQADQKIGLHVRFWTKTDTPVSECRGSRASDWVARQLMTQRGSEVYAH
jgi:hypothetical protein